MTRSASDARKTGPRRRFALRPQAESLEGRQFLSAGDLDLSFSTGGWTTVSPVTDAKETNYDYAHDVAILGDGKILVAGTSYPDRFGLTRLGPDGALDTTFGTGGRALSTFGTRQTYGGMAVQGDGKIVIVGGIDNGVQVNRRSYVYNNDMLIVRYNANGSLDPTFGVGGVVELGISTYGGDSPGDLQNKYDEALGVAVQADGKIVVSGRAYVGAGDYDGVLLRLNPDGSQDTSFGAGGHAVSPDAASFLNVAIQADGKIVVQGDRSGATLGRFNGDGSVDDGTASDTTPGDAFGTGGFVTSTTPLGGRGWENLLIRPDDGSILAQGTVDDGQNSDIGLFRVLGDGTPDSSFGTAGMARVDVGPYEYSGGMALMPDGRIVVVGGYLGDRNVNVEHALIARLTPQGTLDPTFGTGGVALQNFSTTRDEFAGVALQPDGRIVAVGTWYRSANKSTSEGDFLITRFHGDDMTSLSSFGAPSLEGASSATKGDLTILASDWIQSPKRKRPGTIAAR
ncbi:delta-60 repeat domain-containing protein [Tautonia plasticadhaerens]|uniref:Delta-60 repeat domain protein n=1 Tax=Tautonia plasticadhaerens TaxID=2527974 RepID=A0A518HFD7_9BACT|nr:delta-60 repeat domain-containing protein [Tautonia plasticadhaerens]QDV39562.1 hypothetical protein ElP_75330 [Tautonia plasticadhaerens]